MKLLPCRMLLGFICSAISAFPCEPLPQPNVLLVSIDTLRADHLSAYGYHRPTSPNIDSLAKRAVLFEDCVTPIPLTLPAHLSMLTGLHPVEHRVATNGLKVPDSLELLSEMLANLGYETFGAIASQIIGDIANMDQGYGKYVYFNMDDKTERSNAPTNAFLEFLDNRDKSKPFFAFVHYIDVHSPYGGIHPFVNHFNPLSDDLSTFYIEEHLPKLIGEWYRFGEFRSDPGLKAFIAKYDDGIIAADHQIGRLVAGLESNDLFENTLIILTSDHGEGMGDGKGDFNHGDSVYQGSLHVPLIVRLPGGEHASTRNAFPATLMDITPTVLNVLGVELEGRNFSGVSLLPTIADGMNLNFAAGRSRFSSSHSGMGHNYRRAVIRENTKLIQDEWNRGRDTWILKVSADLQDADIFQLLVISKRVPELYAVCSTGQRIVRIPMKTAAAVVHTAADWALAPEGEWVALKTPYLQRFLRKGERQHLQLVRLELNAADTSYFDGRFDSLAIMGDKKLHIIESFENENAPVWEPAPTQDDSGLYEKIIHSNEIDNKEASDAEHSLNLVIEYPRHPYARLLFNLAEDPKERSDIFKKQTDDARALGVLLDTFYESQAPIPLDERSEEAKEILRSMGYLSD